jgi:hypothetical protein
MATASVARIERLRNPGLCREACPGFLFTQSGLRLLKLCADPKPTVLPAGWRAFLPAKSALTALRGCRVAPFRRHV